MKWEDILKTRYADESVRARYEEIQEQMGHLPNKQVQNDFRYEVKRMFENNNGYPLTMQQIETAKIKVSKTNYSR